MNRNRFVFNRFLLVKIFQLFFTSTVISMCVYLSFYNNNPMVFSNAILNSFVYSILSSPLFLFNNYNIRQNKFINYFVFSSLNYIYLLNFVSKIFTKELVTSWSNEKGVLKEYTKTYFYYEINSNSVCFELICLCTFLILQFIFWFMINKKTP